jgi:hypothetical protein
MTRKGFSQTSVKPGGIVFFTVITCCTSSALVGDAWGSSFGASPFGSMLRRITVHLSAFLKGQSARKSARFMRRLAPSSSAGSW